MTNSNGSAVAIRIDDRQYLLTNEHVIRGGNKYTTQIKSHTAVLNVVHSSAAHDLALLELLNNDTRVDTATFAEHIIGESIRIVGFPKNSLNQYISTGTISSLSTVAYNGLEQNIVLAIEGYVNSGNSGGPVLNMHNEVIGIVLGQDMERVRANCIAQDMERVRANCLAIPNSVIQHYLECFKSNKIMPQIGISINKFNNATIKHYYNNHSGDGILVKKSIYTNLLEGDYITKISDCIINQDGIIYQNDQFYPYWTVIKSSFPTDMVTLDIIRNGVDMQIQIQLEPMQSDIPLLDLYGLVFHQVNDIIILNRIDQVKSINGIIPKDLTMVKNILTTSEHFVKLTFTSDDIMIVRKMKN